MAKFSDMVAQATREPYPLELDDGTTVLVPQPAIAVWREACTTLTDLPVLLAAIGVSDDDAAKVRTVLDAAPFGTETVLLREIRNYFRLGN